MEFASKLINWYYLNKRDLPWRNTRDPYKIWLSEIILQQTRVEQGLPYYQKFIETYPTVKKLAGAPIDDVLKLWQGLGYYSRARNLHAAAQQVLNDYNGSFPDNYTSLKKLKGIGDYTAAAIASFAFNEPHAVVDGNVYRVLARVFNISTSIDSTRGKKEFSELANELLFIKDPGIYNQAIMEFGAMYCKPQNPDCRNCIFSSQCLAFAKNNIATLPVKARKTKITARYFYYLVIEYKGSFYLNRRKEKDIWQGLFEFPLIETDTRKSLPQILKAKTFKTILKDEFDIASTSEEYKHILSHQHIHAKFIHIKVKAVDEYLKTFEKVKTGNLKNYAIQRLLENYLLSKNYFA